jgi:prepilin-type N-terminal cleavage/methylation domain-containing protein
MKSIARKQNHQAGFTIVELLIATLVFSMVLVVVTIGVMTFTKSYYRGITQSNTQNTARSVIENITQAIQFSGDKVTSPIGTAGSGSSVGFCIGNQRYSYRLGWQLVDGTPSVALKQTNHELMMDNSGDCSGMNAQDVTTTPTGTELLSPHMRVAKLSVGQIGSTNMYKVTLRVVYGDAALLYSPSGNAAGAAAPDAACKVSIAGSQFCAVSELSSVVGKRIQ